MTSNELASYRRGARVAHQRSKAGDNERQIAAHVAIAMYNSCMLGNQDTLAFSVEGADKLTQDAMTPQGRALTTDGFVALALLKNA